MIKIKVFDYYNHPEYYRYMSESIFYALESAYLSWSFTAEISNKDFTRMIVLKQINEKPQLQ